MRRHAPKHIANGLSLIRDNCSDANRRLHIGIAGGSHGNYSAAVGVSRQCDGTRLSEKYLLQRSQSSVNEVKDI